MYDNLGNDEPLALAVDQEIRSAKKDAWRGNKLKEREVMYAIRKYVLDNTEAERVFELVRNQSEN